jgi:hypothetical protein
MARNRRLDPVSEATRIFLEEEAEHGGRTLIGYLQKTRDNYPEALGKVLAGLAQVSPEKRRVAGNALRGLLTAAFGRTNPLVTMIIAGVDGVVTGGPEIAPAQPPVTASAPPGTVPVGPPQPTIAGFSAIAVAKQRHLALLRALFVHYTDHDFTHGTPEPSFLRSPGHVIAAAYLIVIVVVALTAVSGLTALGILVALTKGVLSILGALFIIVVVCVLAGGATSIGASVYLFRTNYTPQGVRVVLTGNDRVRSMLDGMANGLIDQLDWVVLNHPAMLNGMMVDNLSEAEFNRDLTRYAEIFIAPLSAAQKASWGARAWDTLDGLVQKETMKAVFIHPAFWLLILGVILMVTTPVLGYVGTFLSLVVGGILVLAHAIAFADPIMGIDHMVAMFLGTLAVVVGRFSLVVPDIALASVVGVPRAISKIIRGDFKQDNLPRFRAPNMKEVFDRAPQPLGVAFTIVSVVISIVYIIGTMKHWPDEFAGWQSGTIMLALGVIFAEFVLRWWQWRDRERNLAMSDMGLKIWGALVVVGVLFFAGTTIVGGNAVRHAMMSTRSGAESFVDAPSRTTAGRATSAHRSTQPAPRRAAPTRSVGRVDPNKEAICSNSAQRAAVESRLPGYCR